ncbi:hypothetical protein [Streptomyces sp. NPDC059349]|uniref:hypothetical protein n=1 Tax=Streptomyces sp. NPDC059349 TaxID=3346808 RepID=UPI0036A87E92
MLREYLTASGNKSAQDLRLSPRAAPWSSNRPANAVYTLALTQILTVVDDRGQRGKSAGGEGPLQDGPDLDADQTFWIGLGVLLDGIEARISS